jgi:integrase
MNRPNLKRRGHMYFARYYVPANLQATYGRAEVLRTLKTRDRMEAQRLLPAALVKLANEVSRAVGSQGRPTPSDGLQDAYAEALQQNFAPLLEAFRSRFRAGDATAPEALLDTIELVMEQQPDYWADVTHLTPQELAERAAAPSDLVDAFAWAKEPEMRTLGEWLEEYLTHKARDGCKAGTVATMRRFNERMVRHFGGRTDPRNLSRPAAERYVRQEIDRRTTTRGEPLAHATRELEVTMVIGFLAWLADGGIISSNPFARLTNRLTGADDKERRVPFSDEELQRLLTLPQPHPRLSAVFLLGLFSGLRLEEIAQLQPDDVTGGTFRVRGGKTPSARRSVPIHSIIAPLVERLSETARSGFLLDGLEASGLDQKRSAALSKALGRWLKVALPSSVAVFHSSRHNMGTALERSGAPESTIRLILGHKRQGVTMGTYAHGLELEQLRKVVSAVSYGPEVDGLAQALAAAHPGNRGSAKQADYGPLLAAMGKPQQGA